MFTYYYWDPFNRLSPAKYLLLSQAGTWNSNFIIMSWCFMFYELMWEVIVRFVEFDGIDSINI
jgi:hypothetical protein